MNPGFVELGKRLGKEKLFEYIDKLGFGKKTGIDLNGESKGIIFPLDKVGPLELATTAFGQGVSVTAIQQVQSVSTIINNGIMMQPHVMRRITEPNTGNIIYNVDNKVKKENVISKSTSELVRYVLESVVANGSGRNAYIEYHRVGGKTGTAQKVGSDGRYMMGNYVLSFIGFMPANDPEYVIYIALDNPKGVIQYGGVIVAPIVANVLKNIISLYNIKEDKKGLPREYLWYEERYVTVPDVINKSKKEAIRELKDFTIEYSGSGDKVISTNPEAGSRVKENSIIKLMLN